MRTVLISLIVAQGSFLFFKKDRSTETPTSPSLGFSNPKICFQPQELVQHRLCKEVGKKPQCLIIQDFWANISLWEERENERELSQSNYRLLGFYAYISFLLSKFLKIRMANKTALWEAMNRSISPPHPFNPAFWCPLN